MFNLFAQMPPTDPITAWGSLFLQAGAFGLLVYIVVRLYPQTAKESREERELRDKLFSQIVSGQEVKFDERNKNVVLAIKEQTVAFKEALASQTSSMDQSSRRIEAAVGTACKANLGRNT